MAKDVAWKRKHSKDYTRMLRSKWQLSFPTNYADCSHPALFKSNSLLSNIKPPACTYLGLLIQFRAYVNKTLQRSLVVIKSCILWDQQVKQTHTHMHPSIPNRAEQKH